MLWDAGDRISEANSRDNERDILVLVLVPKNSPADALILGAGDLIKPAAPNLASLGPAFLFFASWYILGAIAFWFIGFETKGRSFEEIDRALATPSAAKVRGV